MKNATIVSITGGLYRDADRAESIARREIAEFQRDQERATVERIFAVILFCCAATARKRTEVVWINPAAASRLNRPLLEARA